MLRLRKERIRDRAGSVGPVYNETSVSTFSKEAWSMSRVLSRLQATLLAVAVLAGLSLAALGLFAVGSRGWYGADALVVRVGFAEIKGVEPGTRVRVQGVDAGEVAQVQPPESPGGPVILHLRLK